MIVHFWRNFWKIFENEDFGFDIWKRSKLNFFSSKKSNGSICAYRVFYVPIFRITEGGMESTPPPALNVVQRGLNARNVQFLPEIAELPGDGNIRSWRKVWLSFRSIYSFHPFWILWKHKKINFNVKPWKKTSAIWKYYTEYDSKFFIHAWQWILVCNTTRLIFA